MVPAAQQAFGKCLLGKCVVRNVGNSEETEKVSFWLGPANSTIDEEKEEFRLLPRVPCAISTLISLI